MADAAQTFRVGNFDIVPCDVDDRDERGLIWMYEPPRPNAVYVIGCDPTVGITGWHRTLRTRDDHLTDNAAIEVIRCGNPDVQVAEYAAPIDAIDVAAPLNLLGRLYAGSNEDGQAQVIVEAQPGPGLSTIRELINTFGYQNLWRWTYIDTYVPKQSVAYGWYSSRRSRQMLWMKGLHYIARHQFLPRSPYLIEEMTDCTPDNFGEVTARAKGRRHDDRVVATLLALWIANEWSMSIEPSEAGGVQANDSQPAWQASDISEARMAEEWEERVSSLLESGGE